MGSKFKPMSVGEKYSANGYTVKKEKYRDGSGFYYTVYQGNQKVGSGYYDDGPADAFFWNIEDQKGVISTNWAQEVVHKLSVSESTFAEKIINKL